MAPVVMKIEGLRELERALRELPKATGKAVLRRTLLKRAKPIAEAAAANATQVTGALARSATASTVLSKRQRALHRKMFRDDKASVEVFAGFGPDPAAHLEEYGSVHNDPNPMLRPAWDAGKNAALEGIKDDLWLEIRKSAARLARKAAKKNAG